MFVYYVQCFSYSHFFHASFFDRETMIIQTKEYANLAVEKKSLLSAKFKISRLIGTWVKV